MTRLAATAIAFVASTAYADTAHDVARVRGLSIKKPIEQATVGDKPQSYYDRETKKLMLVAPVEEFVLIHEIEHALQDQHFDLAKLEAGTGDEAVAHRALVEGDALVTTLEVLLDRKGIEPPWSNPEVVAELTRALDVPVADDVSKAGFQFVAALRAQKPWSAVDAAFKRPPRSTEQVLHPEKYVADEKPIVVDAPAIAGAEVTDTTVWGELGFVRFLLDRGIDPERAKLAAAGWGGDRVTTVKLGTHTATLARFVWDSEVDAIEAYDAAARAIDDSQLAARAEHTETRTRWLGLDGTTSSIERHGADLVIEIGVSCCAAGTAADPRASGQ